MKNRNGSATSKVLRFARTIEVIGNKIPHPAFMFALLWLFIILLSAVCAAADLSVTYMALDKSTGVLAEKTVHAVSMLSRSSLQSMLSSMIKNFSTNSAVPPIMVLSMFMMVADDSGFFKAGLRRLLVNTPDFLTTFILAVVCICINICSTGGYVLAVNLGAIVYKAKGKNPVAGVMVAWAASAAGYTANLLPATTDVTLTEITNVFAAPYGQSIHVLSHWYFMIAATFILAAVTAFVSELYLSRLFPDDPREKAMQGSLDAVALSSDEKRGLRWAGLGILAATGIFLLLTVPKNAFFRNETGALVPDSPLMDSILIVISIFFLVMGVCYGYGSRSYTKAEDIPNAMKKGLESVAGMLIMFFFASQFNYAFNQSGLGTIVAISGERLLEAINLPPIPLLVAFTLLCGTINLVIPSASALWLLLAPMFLPMMIELGISPLYITLAFRIGDTMTNNITPLSVGLPCAIAKVSEIRGGEQEGSGIGTIVSTQIPFSIIYFLVLSVMMAVFYGLGLPLGPGNI